jgi:hypothetical protein
MFNSAQIAFISSKDIGALLFIFAPKAFWERFSLADSVLLVYPLATIIDLSKLVFITMPPPYCCLHSISGTIE